MWDFQFFFKKTWFQNCIFHKNLFEPNVPTYIACDPSIFSGFQLSIHSNPAKTFVNEIKTPKTPKPNLEKI